MTCFFFLSPVVTSTQDEYSSISRNASVGVHGYALVFSITSRSSFENVIKINEALLNALGDAPDVPRVLVGSMKDLSEAREVTAQVSFLDLLWIKMMIFR